MFFRFTNQEIQNSKNSIFPLLEDYELSSFIVNSNNNSNIIKFSITLRDLYSQPKVFNISDAKNYMKIKVFEITSQEIKSQVRNIDSIPRLNKIILDNNLNYVDLSAGYDFTGNKINKNSHYIQNGYLLLNYTSQYTTNNNLNNYSLGIVFYYDYGNYLNNNNNITPESTEKIFIGNIKIIDIYENSRILTFSGVQDLRITNDIFYKNSPDITLLAQQQGYSKTLKLLSEKQFKNIKLGQYISNAYFSRKINGELGFVFNINKHKLLKENSQYINNFIDSPLGEEYLKQSKFSSIKIVRRQVDKNKKPIFDNVDKTYYKVIESGQVSNIVAEKNSDVGSIKQISLVTDNTNKINTFEITDKTIFLKTDGYYQYGVQISILDGFTDYLKTVIDVLNTDNKKLKNYLEQTSKTVTTNSDIINILPHNEVKILNLNGYYDPISNRFTSYFTSFIYPKIFQRDLLNAINLMVNIVKFFNKSVDEEKTILTLLNLINPAIASFSTISYFIELHTKFISNINSLIKNNKNSFIELEHWFNNEIIDCSEKINIGYSFIDLSFENGLGTITGEKYKNKILNDVKRYSLENSLFEEQKNKSTAFVAIENINSKNFSLNIKNIDNNIDYYDAFNYAEIELDIKNYLFNKDEDKNINLSFESNALKPEIQTLKQKMNSLFNSLNIVNVNSFIPIDDSKNIRLNNGSDTNKDNNLNDPSLLFLALAKKLNIEKNTFKNDKVTKNILDTTDIKHLDLLAEQPYQIELLLKEKSRIFKNDFKYLSDLTLNSKFLLLFNTLHKVELLMYENNNIRNEAWKPLTLDLINTLDGSDNYLCRLSPCNNENYNLKNFIDIKLPIYNKYFLLNEIGALKSVSLNQILIPKEEKALSLSRQLLNTQPVVERYAKSFDNIPVYYPPNSSDIDETDVNNNGSSVTNYAVEDFPEVQFDLLLVPNTFTKAFPEPGATIIYDNNLPYKGIITQPTHIAGPDLIYKVSDGKGGYKNPPPPININSTNNEYVINGDTVRIKNFGDKKENDKIGELFDDGIIYKFAYGYNLIKEAHQLIAGQEEQAVAISAAEYEAKIKSKDEIDSGDVINEFGQRVLAFGKHYSIGTNQRLRRGNIGSGEHFQLKSQNGKYVFSIDITMKEFKIVSLERNISIWKISQDTLKNKDSQLKKNGISGVYFNDGQLQIYSAIDTNKIFMQFGPFTPNDKQAYMIMQDDGNLVIYNGNGIPTWESQTHTYLSYGPSNLVIDGTAPEVYLEGEWGSDYSKIVSSNDNGNITGTTNILPQGEIGDFGA